MRRTTDNKDIHVRRWYAPLAKKWLAAQYHALREFRLIIDATKVGFGHQFFIVCIAYRRRAIPIAWTWLQSIDGHSTARKQIALLGYVKSLLPRPLAAVIIVGDNEFGSIATMRQPDKWRWWYVFCQRKKILIWLEDERAWNRFNYWVK